MLLSYFVPIFIILVALEAYLSYREQKQIYELKDTFASLSLGVGSLVVSFFAKGGIYLILAYLHTLTPLKIPSNWWTNLLCFILVDFCLYWAHRFGHETRIGWAAHIPHHTSLKYNFATALRQSWTHHYFFIFYLIVPLVGFEPEVAFTMNAANTIYQFFLHTEYIGKLGPLEWVLNTPSHHRVHHGSNPRYLDKNYGGTLIIWDRLFGTFQAEDEKVIYGITRNVSSFNPIFLTFHEWIDMFKDFFKADNFSDKFKHLFYKPGWVPNQSKKIPKVFICPILQFKTKK